MKVQGTLEVGSNISTDMAVYADAVYVTSVHAVDSVFAAAVYASSVHAANYYNTSDRNLKENFTPIDGREILKSVAETPISSWNFKTDPAVRHVGPMAQDFRAAFGLGQDDKHIGLGDEAGVALAAIQGLNQKVESETAALRAENAELKARLERLEQLITVRNGGGK